MKNQIITSSKTPEHQKLYSDIAQLIQQGRKHVATEVNATVVLLYWSIGKRINDEILLEKRADYGDRVIDTVSKQLTQEFGKGYSRSALFRMIRFSKLYPDQEIVATVSRQLSWSHIVTLCQMDNELQRDFYMQMACIERWSVRTLRDKLGSMKTRLLKKHFIPLYQSNSYKQFWMGTGQTIYMTAWFMSVPDPPFHNIIGGC